MGTRMLQRRGTASQWSAGNPVLGDGEVGFARDTKDFKIGDGVTAWNDLTPPFSSLYVSYATKASDSEKLDGLDSTAYSLVIESDLKYLAKSGGTITGTLIVGDQDTDYLVQKATVFENHSRSQTLGYTGTNLTSVVEMSGGTTVRTTTLNYDVNGRLTSTVEVAAGQTVTTTLVYDGSGNLTGTTRAVV